jgi:hypothetical protein
VIVLVIGENSLNRLGIVIVTLFGFCFSSGAQELVTKQDKNLLSQEQILKTLKKVEGTSLKNFLDTMTDVSVVANEFIKLKEKECSGDYTSFIINENGDKVYQKNKLTRKEKKICKHSLINFQIKVSKTVFKLRKDYLKRLHIDQLKKLETLQGKRLSELEVTASQYK